MTATSDVSAGAGLERDEPCVAGDHGIVGGIAVGAGDSGAPADERGRDGLKVTDVDAALEVRVVGMEVRREGRERHEPSVAGDRRGMRFVVADLALRAAGATDERGRGGLHVAREHVAARVGVAGIEVRRLGREADDAAVGRRCWARTRCRRPSAPLAPPARLTSVVDGALQVADEDVGRRVGIVRVRGSSRRIESSPSARRRRSRAPPRVRRPSRRTRRPARLTSVVVFAREIAHVDVRTPCPCRRDRGSSIDETNAIRLPSAEIDAPYDRPLPAPRWHRRRGSRAPATRRRDHAGRRRSTKSARHRRDAGCWRLESKAT